LALSNLSEKIYERSADAFARFFLIFKSIFLNIKILIEIPPLDPLKVTQRPNMRRLNLIQVNELDFLPGKSTVLGQGAFGIVYAVCFYSEFSKRIF